MDYNNPYNFGDVVEVGDTHPRVFVIFGEFKHDPCEGIIYAVGNQDTFGQELKPHGLRKIGENKDYAFILRGAYVQKAPDALKELK